MNSDSPIGMFDSGMGGISVLKTALRLMPAENFVYFGDTANAPYGDKSESEILKLSLSAVDKLLKYDIKALVIACNTATAASANALRRRLSIPVIGMEPALKPASSIRHGGKVIVLATKATLSLEKFHILMEKYGADAYPLPAPELVHFVESGVFDSPKLDSYLSELFSPYKNDQIDAVVLGCTHYPFLKSAIQRAAGSGAVLVDGNEGTIKRLISVLEEKSLTRKNGKGSVALLSSKTGGDTIARMEKLLYF
ncbi:MAG: glutamate racemase [Eubacteriales bacterium]|nr:glutamate racemase [Eubacteriales bacterium]MDD3882557.1 glutamate racemase [Eubacteriales bacterium]MDD4512856.1 glutamate racemase [Eubacteriales bacterium]